MSPGHEQNGAHTLPEEYRLVLVRSSHVVIRIVGKLEDMWRVLGFLLCCVSILCSILSKSGVGVACNIFMRVQCDKRVAANTRVNRVGKEPFAERRDDNVVRDIFESS